LRRADRPFLLLLALALTAGCAHYQVNPRLATANPNAGYRYKNLTPGPGNSDSLFVILAFSGGGTRAAALSYGVMEQLAKTMIYWEGSTRSLLSEVDVISSVSGGSFPAAYYALYGDRIFQDFESRFLKQPIQNRLFHNLFYPQNFFRLPSPYFDRIDMAAEIYGRDVFDDKTFADLIRKGTRPYLILNATDMTAGSRFELTQDQFDPICSDLAGVPIARGVAASSAFPGLLSPMTLKSYAGTCNYQPPGWYATASEDKKNNPRRFAEAQTLAGYLDGKQKPFVHLLDGGISDNVGGRAPIQALISGDSPWSLVTAINQGTIKKVVVITVNAKTAGASDWDRKERSPGVVNALSAAANTPMDHYSFETVVQLTEQVRQDQQNAKTFADFQAFLKRTCPAAELPAPAMPKVDYYTIDVSFDAVEDAKERSFLQNLPTTFQLPPDQIDCLRGVGGNVLAKSEGFSALLDDLDAGARAQGVAPPPRAAVPAVAKCRGR
jgi:predicted acylesterase/phospholipase RssA